MQERQSGNDSGENGNSSDDFKNVSDLHSDCRTGPISIRRFRIGKQFRKVTNPSLPGEQALPLFREN
jgi:hypothetical protein